jgi:archaellum biogenesis ATPase FlaH
LEVLDFDAKHYPKDRDFYEDWKAALILAGHESLLAKLTLLIKTPSGGWHVPYRCLDGVGGNTKLALALVHEDIPPQEVIETRGNGGYVVAWPSPGYSLASGSWGQIPVVSGEERDALLSVARSLSETNDRPYTHDGPREARRPGDDFARTHSWADVLGPHGWALARETAGEGYWTRPGKKVRDGTSATTNYKGSDLLKVFSSNAHPFEPGATYTKFAAFSFLEYGGNFIEAAKHLGRSGYGDQQSPDKRQEPRVMVGTDHERKPQGWTRASQITPAKVEFLFEPYIPRGEVTILSGDPGVGKSTVAQAIATACTNGTDVLGIPVAQGPVVFMSAEQSRATVTVPRFKEMGADLDLVTLPDEEDEQGDLHPFVLDANGIAELKAVAEGLRPVLIVVDTITAYFEATRDFNTANSVREWMRRLNSIARAVNCSIVCIAHNNKAVGQKALHRVSGSVDFTGAARSLLICGADPDNKNETAISHEKSNVGPKGRAIAFTVENGAFGWIGFSDLDGERMCEAPQTREARGRRDECADWLVEVLSQGAQDATVMERRCKEMGFSKRIYSDAKKLAGVVSDRDKFGGEGSWQWRLKREATTGQDARWGA